MVDDDNDDESSVNGTMMIIMVHVENNGWRVPFGKLIVCFGKSWKIILFIGKSIISGSLSR